MDTVAKQVVVIDSNATMPIDQETCYVVAIGVSLKPDAIDLLTEPILGGRAQFTWGASENFVLNYTSYTNFTAAIEVVAAGKPLSKAFAIDGAAATQLGTKTSEELLDDNFWIDRFPLLQSIYIPRVLCKADNSTPSTLRYKWRTSRELTTFFPHLQLRTVTREARAAAHVALATRWLSDDVRDAQLAAFEMQEATELAPDHLAIANNWAIAQSFCGRTKEVIEQITKIDDQRFRDLEHRLQNRAGVEPPLTRAEWIAAEHISTAHLPLPAEQGRSVYSDGTPIDLIRIAVTPSWTDELLLEVFKAYVETFSAEQNIDLAIPRGSLSSDEAFEKIFALLNQIGNPDDMPDITIDDAESLELMPMGRYVEIIDSIDKVRPLFHALKSA